MVSKELLFIGTDKGWAEIINKNGVYYVEIDGNFYCSCDNMDEVRSEIAQLNV